MEPQQEAQERQYTFPYHYLPVVEDGRFRQHRYWSWGYRYLGRLRVALDLLGGLDFRSLIDVGCGDGRFLVEVQERFGDLRLLGIDSSGRAITLARQMSPALRYERVDIVTHPPDDRFEVATLLEVIEHVPPDILPRFLSAVAGVLEPGGYLIVTAPHVNAPLPKKHFQHFEPDRLREVLPPSLTLLKTVAFDRSSRLLSLLQKLMGGSGRYFVLTHPGLNDFLLRYYLERCLYGGGERRCQRIACLARKGSG